MKEKTCNYRDRQYSVREDGSIFRHPKTGCKPSKLDNTWSFGKKDAKTGYMLYGGIRVHQVVATAFHGVPDGITRNIVLRGKFRKSRLREKHRLILRPS